uniref:DUF834 domain-containing protein n=2 Tax=Oryza sativa subsp. japonica TaxID=39947 RepID=Q10JK7_ORYSJ|nr:hypothetical protein [Oryza sativa Japonica Group]ABF96621.1 hypothetical protein LOC_Os03g30280 [Oryza sativa Japonica Group]
MAACAVAGLGGRRLGMTGGGRVGGGGGVSAVVWGGEVEAEVQRATAKLLVASTQCVDGGSGGGARLEIAGERWRVGSAQGERGRRRKARGRRENERECPGRRSLRGEWGKWWTTWRGSFPRGLIERRGWGGGGFGGGVGWQWQQLPAWLEVGDDRWGPPVPPVGLREEETG